MELPHKKEHKLIVQPTFRDVMRFAPPPIMGDGFGALFPKSGAAGPSYYPVGSDCVLYHAYWDGTAVDHSSAGNDGTVVGAEFVTNALSLDGADDRVVVTVTNSLKVGTGDFTIVAWYNEDAVTHDTQGAFLSLEHSSNIVPAIYTGRLTGGTIVNYCYDDPTWNSGYGVTLAGGTAGNWHCWVYSADRDVGGQVSLDDSAIYTAGNTLSYDFQAYNRCYMGYRWGYWYKGLLGEILMFNTAWTQTQVDSYFAATKARYGL